jgi:class 3 adenylate cyclase/TolB-like protein
MKVRKLAAIMFSDIVGYTALMGSDEDKAFDVLRKNRQIHLKFIDQFNGTLIKEMGDGILAQFNSAADSVRCGIDIQQQARKELDAQIRMGIHLGDITVENNDVFGDGVNIASRLQSICDPGGIYISESIHHAIRSQKDIDSQYLGEIKLKNVNYPFRTYFIKEKGLPVPEKHRIDELTGTKKTESILVLPFDNYTGSDELEYFVAGMHASLIGAMGRVSAMRVISKTTANAFKNTEKSIPEIATELDVDTVVEASVLSLAEKICLQVKLINAHPEEKQLWSQDFIEEKSEVLNLYNSITKKITEQINVILTPRDKRTLDESRTVDRQVYDKYLKGMYYAVDLGPESLIKARDYLNSAIEKDPDWAPLYAALATIWLSIAASGVEPPEIAVPIVYENLNRALESDPDLVEAHYVAGFMAWTAEWNWEKAEKEFLKALAIDPSHSFSRIHYAHMLYTLQRSDEGLAQAKRAYQLDPLNPLIQSTYGVTLLCEGDCASAVSVVEKLLASDPNNFLANNVMEPAAFQCGDLDRTFKAHKIISPIAKENMIEIEKIYHNQGFNAAFTEIMKQLEDMAKKDYVVPADMAMRYYMINQDGKVLDWIEKGAEIHDVSTLYVGTGFCNFTRLHNNPRFIELLIKMNLPLPQIT